MGPIPNLPPQSSSMHDLPLPFVMPFNWVKSLLKNGTTMSIDVMQGSDECKRLGWWLFPDPKGVRLVWSPFSNLQSIVIRLNFVGVKRSPSTPQRWGELHFGGATAAGYWSWFHLWTCAKMRTPTKQGWSGWKRWKEFVWESGWKCHKCYWVSESYLHMWHEEPCHLAYHAYHCAIICTYRCWMQRKWPHITPSHTHRSGGFLAPWGNGWCFPGVIVHAGFGGRDGVGIMTSCKSPTLLSRTLAVVLFPCHVIFFTETSKKSKDVQGNQRHVLFGLCLWPWSNLSSSKRLGNLLPPRWARSVPHGDAAPAATGNATAWRGTRSEATNRGGTRWQEFRDVKSLLWGFVCCGMESGFKTLIFQRLGVGEFRADSSGWYKSFDKRANSREMEPAEAARIPVTIGMFHHASIEFGSEIPRNGMNSGLQKDWKKPADHLVSAFRCI